MRGATVGERVEGDLGGGVLGLTESGAVLRTLEDLAVKVDGGLEPGRVVRTFPNARVGRKVEAAPLGQLLKLVFVHFFFCSSPLYFPLTPKLSLSSFNYYYYYSLSLSLSLLCASHREKNGGGPRSDPRVFGSYDEKKRVEGLVLDFSAGE